MLIGLAAALIFIALLLLLPNYLLKEFVLDQLEQQLDREVTADSMRLALVPMVRLELTGVTVRETPASEALFRADRLEVTHRLLPLLRRQPLTVERVTIEHPWLFVHRDADGQWSVPAVRTMDNTRDDLEPAGQRRGGVSIKEIRLTQGAVTLADDSRPAGAGMLSITGIEGSLALHPNTEAADVHLFALLPAQGHLSTFTLIGSGAASQGRVQFEGALQAGAVEIQKVAGLFMPPAQAEGLKGSGHVGVQFSLASQAEGYEVFLSEFTLQADPLALRGRGYVEGLGTEAAAYAFTVSSSPIAVERLLEWLPLSLIPVQWHSLALEDELGGTVTVHDATMTAAPAEGLPIEWSGAASLSEGRLLVGPERTPIRDLSARVEFDAEHVQVTDLRGSYGAVLVTDGAVLLTDLPSSPAMDATAAGTGQAVDLMRMLPAHLPSGEAQQMVTAIEEVSGEVEFALHVGGPLSDGGVELIEATLTAQDVALRSDAWPMPIRINGGVQVSPGEVHFKEFSGRLGAIPVKVVGRIDLGDHPKFDDVIIVAQADPQELAGQFLAGKAEAFLRASDGPVHLRAKLSGPVSSPQVTGALDLKDLAVTLGEVFKKAPGTPGAIEFAAGLSDKRVVTIDKLALDLPPARLVARGLVRLDGDPSFEATIASRPMMVAQLPAGLMVGPIREGRLSTVLDMKGQGYDWTAWDMSGWIELDQGLAVVDGLDEAFRQIAVRLEVNQDEVRIERAGVRIGESDLQVSGLVRQWRQAPQVTLAVTSSDLNLNLLTPKEDKPVPRPQAVGAEDDSWMETVDLSASVQIDRANYGRILLEDVAGRIRVSEGRLYIDRVRAETEYGQLGGEVLVSREGGAPLVEGSWRFNGLPVEHVLSAAGRKDEVLTGQLSIRGEVRSALRETPPPRETLKTLGDVHILIEGGRMKRVPLLANLLKVINLPALVQGESDVTSRGLAFDRLAGIFSVDRGVVTVKQLYLEAPTIKISGTGEYDLVADELDLAMAASPLQSYSNFLKNLPLVGRLFAGERRGLGTTLFEVKGPLAEPRVRALPLESLASGVTGMFKFAQDVLVNTVTLPADLFMPEKTKKPRP